MVYCRCCRCSSRRATRSVRVYPLRCVKTTYMSLPQFVHLFLAHEQMVWALLEDENGSVACRVGIVWTLRPKYGFHRSAVADILQPSHRRLCDLAPDILRSDHRRRAVTTSTKSACDIGDEGGERRGAYQDRRRSPFLRCFERMHGRNAAWKRRLQRWTF